MRLFRMMTALVCAAVLSVPALAAVGTDSGEAPASELVDCHVMTERWFGDEVADLPPREESSLERAVAEYFSIRVSALAGAKKATLLGLGEKLTAELAMAESAREEEMLAPGEDSSGDVSLGSTVAQEDSRRQAQIQRMQNRLNITITDCDSTVRIVEESFEPQADGSVCFSAYEWVFFDYDDLSDGPGGRDVSGFGTRHRICMAPAGKVWQVVYDRYDEGDLFGVTTMEKGASVINAPTKNSYIYPDTVDEPPEEGASLMSVDYYAGYNPAAVAEYANAYWQNYNPSYYNFNPVGGDCANFVSQSIHAGGMPMVRGGAYGADGWFYNTAYDRSATWTGVWQLRDWMAKNRGVRTAASSTTVFPGSPMFYNDEHAAICVGYNSAGVPVVNAHNTDRYQVPWNYWSTNTGYTTVQLTPSAYYIPVVKPTPTASPVSTPAPTPTPAPVSRVPEKPAVTVEGSNVRVSWRVVENTTRYEVYLVQAPWEWKDIQDAAAVKTGTTSYVFTEVPKGEYRAFVIARPAANTERSEMTGFTVSVGADPTPAPPAGGDGRLIVTGGSAAPGSVVDVALDLPVNPGVASMRLNVDYNRNVLTLTEIRDGGILGAEYDHNANRTPPSLSWDNDTANANVTATGRLATLRFRVSPGAPAGVYPVTVSYSRGEIYDISLNNVSFLITAGSVSVTGSGSVGDVNRDGEVSSKDRAALSRYLSNWEGYNADTLDLSAADVNGDGVVNAKDRAVLSRYLAHWPGYEYLPYTGDTADLGPLAPAPTLRLESKEALPGGIVELRLLLEDNPGLASLSLELGCAEGLELLRVENGGILSLDEPNPAPGNVCRLSWTRDTAADNWVDEGALATLRIRLPENAAGSYPVSIRCDSGDVYDVNLSDLPVNLIGGEVRALAPATGTAPVM